MTHNSVYSAANGFTFYKDCYRQCLEDGCNSNNDVEDEYTKLDEEGNPVELECYEYSDVDLPDSPGDDFDQLPNLNDKTRDCPRFANWGCFTANFSSNGVDIGDSYSDSINKGCSIFEIENGEMGETCSTFAQGTSYCKKQCENNRCNVDGMATFQCQQCEMTFDHTGNVISGDSDCFTSPANHLVDCSGGVEMCSTYMKADFTYEGQMVYTFNRGCVAPDTDTSNDGQCNVENNVNTDDKDDFKMEKECFTFCDSSDCNANNDIEDLFAVQGDAPGIYPVHYCYEYSSEYDDEYDPAAPGYGEGKQCPMFANAGCFASNFTTGDTIGFNRGCSPFMTVVTEPVCIGDTDSDDHSCKQYCSSHFCNRDKIRSPTRCHVCTATFDHTGKPLSGETTDACYTVADDYYLEQCELIYDHCETDTVTDWLPNGAQRYTLHRRCAVFRDEPDQPMTKCFQGNDANTGSIYKDCYNHCYGDGCNDNNSVEREHSRLDEDGNPVELTCYEYNIDTSILDYPQDGATRLCPLYANWGCFKGNFTEGDWESDDDDYVDQLNKGCSMFEPEVRPFDCEDYKDGSYGCKVQCADDHCNRGDIVEPALQCQQCKVVMDHMGNVLSGTANCMSDTDAHLVDCPAESTLCYNKMIADFTIWGSLNIEFERACGTDDNDVNGAWECDIALSVDVNTTDEYDVRQGCIQPCKSSRCNNNNDVADFFVAAGDDGGPRRQYCHGYSSDFDPDYDGYNDVNDPEITLGEYQLCPTYANRGCFVSNYTNFDGSLDKNNGFYRGCSPFNFDSTAPVGCGGYINDNGQLWGGSCKQQCTTDYCNSNIIKPPVNCYVCVEIFDHAGNRVNTTTNEANCGTLIDDEYLQECDLSLDHCETDLITDWLPDGKQTYILERKCSKYEFNPDNPTDCVQGVQDNGFAYYKDCFNYCLNDGCNSNNDVELEFTRIDPSTGEAAELECFEFASPEDLPGDNYEGNFDEIPSLNSKSRQCPRFANWGCFTANFTNAATGAGSTIHDNAINKGCSMFDLGGERDVTCSDFYDATYCKKQCIGDKCNVNGMEPPNYCQVCSESLDHTGRVSNPDIADLGCYNMTTDYQQMCPIGQPYCFSKMTVDWYLSGAQLIQFERGCTATPPHSEMTTTCATGESSQSGIIYKDCTLRCKGDDCNIDKEVELGYTKYDDNGQVAEIKCYEYASFIDFDGDDDTQIDQDSDIDQRQRQCPRFANNGCFKGNQTTEPGSKFEGAYPNSFNKGCSMFDLGERSNRCIPQDGSSIFDGEVQSCKQHCTTELCNEGDQEMTLSEISCQVCSQRIDHMGNPGHGDVGCYNGTVSYEEPCAVGYSYCGSSLVVDWYTDGSQGIKFERFCAAEEDVPETDCVEGGMVDGSSYYKDCTTTCQTDNCNNDNDVELLYSKLDATGEPVEMWCYEYLTPRGTNVDQGVGDIDWVVRQCPRFANNGCFRGNMTGGSFHKYNAFNKGCSMFDVDQGNAGKCATVDDGTVACKSLCDESFCNKGDMESGNTPSPPIRCHQCMETYDHMGNRIDENSDDNCYDLDHDAYLNYCRGDDQYCATTLRNVLLAMSVYTV